MALCRSGASLHVQRQGLTGHPPFSIMPSASCHRLKALALCATILLASCGGGGGSDSALPKDDLVISAGMVPAGSDDAYRFLTQASMGPSSEDIARLNQIGYDNWIDEQFKLHLQVSHLKMAEDSAAALGATSINGYHVNYSWWTHAIKDPAQLRQRVAFALSEIFVVSSMTVDNGRTVASYLDMLTDKADGNYRDLLEAVAMHPAMGQYLSHLANRKEDLASGRVPDENFAREVMQLFSIGLYELDDSGNPIKENGLPKETYTASDISGVAKVFTGFSWNWPSAQSAVDWWKCFWRNTECRATTQDVDNMSAYAAEHTVTEINFLGIKIPLLSAQATGDMKKAKQTSDLKAVLDRLAEHPNTAPFISKQLIQRLVTSNPSNTYVADITHVFRANHGNLREVVKAILLHDEARHPNSDANAMARYGKLREPVLRLTHLLRSIPHTSARYASGLANGTTPFLLAVDTGDAGTALGQTPMRAPSVFNFFRPGYQPPQGQFADEDLVAPEMQITNETSVLGYANFISTILAQGWSWDDTRRQFDVQFDLSQWNSNVASPADLVQSVSEKLLGHVLPDDVRLEAEAAISTMPATNATQRKQRIQAAILLVALSPSFIIRQ